MAGIFSRYFTQPEPKQAAPKETNPPFPQMVAPIESYYPTPVTPAPAPSAVQQQPLMQGQVTVQPQSNPLTDWLLNWAQNPGQPVVGNAQPAEPAQAIVIPAPPSPQVFAPQPVVQPAQQQPQTVAQQIPVLQQQQPPTMNPQAPPADYTQQATAIQQWLASGGQNPGLPVGTQPTQQLPIQVLNLPTIDNPEPGWSVPELQAKASNAATARRGGTETESRAVPVDGKKGGTETESRAVPVDGKKGGTETESRAVPVGEPGAMFLMRPRGLSGPDGKREDAENLTNYEGLANNAKARRLTWDEYNSLSEEDRRAADLNKLLVRSREDDLNREGQMTEVQKARYYANVASVFGPGGTQSETVAPRTVDLLASIDYNAVGKDLDDFLSLKEGISSRELKKGGADMTAADAVQTRAQAAFAEKPDQYWNLNSAVRDNTVENKPGKALPGLKNREPQKDADGNVIWTKDYLYDRMYEGIRNNEPDWNDKNIEALLTKLELDDNDRRELARSLYLRAQNEKLYSPGTSEVMSDDGKKKRRTPDEILKFLGIGG